MGKVVNTTNIVDTTYLLSQTPKNLVPDNYWLRELQEKVDADWRFRPNRVDVEEETAPGEEQYTPLEVVIQSVRDDKGTKVSDDWRRVVFKDIFRKIKYMLLIVGSISFICRNGKIKFITFRKSSYLIFEIFECCS